VSDAAGAPARIRPIESADADEVAEVLRAVRREYGMQRLEAPILEVAELDLHRTAQLAGCAYWVAEKDGCVVGGAGFGPLAGVAATCQLQRMYLLPHGRRMGIGRALLKTCLRGARRHGYRACYVETMRFMTAARSLYESAGFERLDAPIGHTGHSFPTAWYLLCLQPAQRAGEDRE